MENASNALILRRPNGRLQACEPCRKRKLACDHTRPVCSRCRKRKQGESCVYVVLPSSSKPSGPRRSLPSPASPGQHSPPRNGTIRPLQVGPTIGPEVQVPTGRPGYLGFTSYCTVIEETENSLSRVQGPGSVTLHCGSAAQSPPDEPVEIMSPRIRDMCLIVLHNVPDAGRECTLSLYNGSDSWFLPVAQRLYHSLYDTFGHYFVPDRSVSKLEELARLLCVNTTRPFSDDESDPERWVSQFSGRNMRWEALGILSIFMDFAPTPDPGSVWKGSGSAGFDRASRTTSGSLHLCHELCKEFSAANSLVLCLSLRCTVVDSRIFGDADISVWRGSAERISLLTFLGFHAVAETDRNQACMSSEIKKRLFYSIYAVAMVVVAFTGRPPLLSGRFTSTPLPLDISDDDLFSKDNFAKAVKQLDDRGWNTDGRMHKATQIRARGLIAAISEEVLEIALSHKSTASIQTLLDLRARQLRMKSEFPHCLHYNPKDLENPKVPVETLGPRIFIQLEHLQNLFFIERLLLRYGHEDNGDLLSVSFDMVSLALSYWTHLDRLAPYRIDCEWLVMAYAVPAGGILCLELLKPTLHVRTHIDPIITRSAIIQKLSLLIGYLDWLGPSGPNGNPCSDAKSVIERVLNHTLNATSSIYDTSAAFEWDSSTQLDFNFDLLDTFDWNRPDVLSSQQSN
ncbi:hypothetical protein GGS23DRAFT_604761 [Durotheca rogersii]|uniref:uncharacterized protein n=1 Tax=Durotheca rogersii TaxID=419775 RepID=UPI002220419C|nr:uncharacterized protein GGS23DRAFT_604761 [Durotheca rogersii]KAI5863752.1 hypothetical protein GGS23DRAFT_604761 [Durotheca rogersii]